MRSPAQIAQQLARQWQRADWREHYLLGAREAWPLVLPIGLPAPQEFAQAGLALQAHLRDWRAVGQAGPGQVRWAPRNYRTGTAPVEVPTHWELARPSQCMEAIARFAGPQGTAVCADHEALAAVLAGVDGRYHRLLLRRLALWRGTPVAQVIAAARGALQLEPGCAQGLPLRALAVDGNDSKFFERHATLILALLDERFDGEASRQGLAAFLGALNEEDHWLLVAPLAPGLLPFERQRVRASELQIRPLPCRQVLVVENERCLHALPQPLPDTVAVLGAGLDLGWLAAPWLRERKVAYWGDMDTWGLRMLATARAHVPDLHALLMDRTTFDAHAHLAVPEPAQAPELPAGVLAFDQAQLDAHLRSLDRGRLEQEFLPLDRVRRAVGEWMRANAALSPDAAPLR